MEIACCGWTGTASAAGGPTAGDATFAARRERATGGASGVGATGAATCSITGDAGVTVRRARFGRRIAAVGSGSVTTGRTASATTGGAGLTALRTRAGRTVAGDASDAGIVSSAASTTTAASGLTDRRARVGRVAGFSTDLTAATAGSTDAAAACATCQPPSWRLRSRRRRVVERTLTAGEAIGASVEAASVGAATCSGVGDATGASRTASLMTAAGEDNVASEADRRRRARFGSSASSRPTQK